MARPKPPQRKPVQVRVPFVQRCALLFEGGASASAFIVNINTLGVYIAHDEMPAMGQPVRVTFNVPHSEIELALQGVVAWLNPRQQHPVHSLPAGFGVQFRGLSAEDARSIERVIADYKARAPTSG